MLVAYRQQPLGTADPPVTAPRFLSGGCKITVEMVVRDAMTTGIGAVRRNPTVVAGGLLLAVVGELWKLAIVASVGPPYLSVLVLFAAGPFALAGLVGMADGVLSGPTDLGEFVDSGTRNYVDVLLGAIGFAVVVGIVWVSAVILFYLIAFGDGPAGIPVHWLLVLTAVFAAMMALQFFDVGIVVDDRSGFESLPHSVGLVRENLSVVVRFSLVYGAVWTVAVLPGIVLFVRAFGALPTGVVVSEWLLGASVTTALALESVSLAVLSTYKVAFYRTLLDRREAGRTQPDSQATGDNWA